MATKNTAARDDENDVVTALYDRLAIRTAGGSTDLVIYAIGWDASSSGVAAVASVPIAGTGLAAGTAAEGRLYHSSESREITGFTVGTSGADIIIDNTSIEVDQAVNLVSFTRTEPASTA